MRYEGRRPGNGEWHCPFSPEWVDRMKHAAECCKSMSAKQIEAVLDGVALHYELPPGDFLSDPQDARGLPLSWCREEEYKYRKHPKCCTAIYDYESIPEVVVANGEDDWPLFLRGRILMA